MSDKPFIAAFVVCSGLLLLTWLLQVWFLAKLRRTEPTAWQAVATPGWLNILSWSSLAFFQLGRYRSLECRRLRRFGFLLRVLQLLSIGPLILLAVLLART